MEENRLNALRSLYIVNIKYVDKLRHLDENELHMRSVLALAMYLFTSILDSRRGVQYFINSNYLKEFNLFGNQLPSYLVKIIDHSLESKEICERYISNIEWYRTSELENIKLCLTEICQVCDEIENNNNTRWKNV